MPRTSSAVKNKYNNKAYDRVNLVLHKGNKANLQSIAESLGESANEFINVAIEQRIKRESPEAVYDFKYTDSNK